MKRLMDGMARYFEQVPDRMRRRKVVAWLFFLAATVFLAMGIGRARFDASIEGWFDQDDPMIVAFDWFHHEFGSDDHLYIAYKPKDGDVFSEQSLKTLLALHQEIEAKVAALQPGDGSALKHVVKVSSLINAPVLRAEEDVLISRKLVGDRVPDTAEGREALRSLAQTQDAFPLLYFSKDFKHGGLLIETNFGAIPIDEAGVDDAVAVDIDAGGIDLSAPEAPVPGGEQARPKFKPTDLAEYLTLMEAVKAIIHKPEYAAHFEYYPVGAIAAAEFNLEMISEMGMLNVAALLIIMLLLWMLFRSLSAVFWPIVIVILSCVWMVGITAWLGLPITAFVMIAVMLTLAIGVADTVHVLSEYMSARNAGREHPDAMRHAFRHVAVACLLTSVTNIAAMLALSITPVVPIKVFAFMCALGVALPFLFTAYMLPLMLDLWAPKKAADFDRTLAGRVLPDVSALLSRMLRHVLPIVERRPSAFIAAFMAVFVVCIYGASQTRIDTDPVGSFAEDSLMKRSVRLVDANMMGAQSMEVYLDLGVENAFHDPAVLHAVEKLQERIETRYDTLVVRTSSIVDTVKNSYRTLNQGRPEMYVIPESSGAVSQTLFLFNQSNPEDRRTLVSDNYDKARISVRMYNAGSYVYARSWEQMGADIEATVAEIRKTYPQAQVSITGALALMMQGADYLTRSQVTNFALALVLISGILLLMFGTLKAGAVALIPNLIPAILAYGLLGLLDIPLDITTMMIAPIIIGIAVDDTVHFLTRYRSEVSAHGDIRRALRTTIDDTGQAVVFTTLVLGLGFGIMGFASDGSVSNLGIFGSLALLMGLLNDLFLLPAMILLFKLDFRKESAASLMADPPPVQEA
ncbi:MAG: MMPL family transporter [Lysobacter sp.]|nr:MMPL family transporter [Lysobacter sp.]